ncbi:MAG: hypothetical protein AABX29_00515, partial [Nanoarchaeota archaeon]
MNKKGAGGIVLVVVIIAVISLMITGAIIYLVLKPDNIITKPKCGDNICDANENWKSCLKDCDKPLKAFCGDKVCETKEVGVCLADCPKNSVCGDG